MTASTPARRTISQYELIEPIGQGAMGEVWLARDTQLPRQVAVKLLPRHLASDEEAVSRLLREAQAAASVDHPAVVTVYQAGLADGQPYLVMQRVEGETLEKRLERGPMPVREAIALASAISDALAEVHALGIVHRDLKPSNIILTPRGPKILDFGVASVRDAPGLTRTGVSPGTPFTMSPEQLRGMPADNRSDLWALGVIFYQALTGKRPFEGNSVEAVMHQVLNHPPTAPSRLRSGIATDLDFMVMKLLRKDPAHRYARAEELMSDLASVGAGVEDGAGAAGATTTTRLVPRLAVLYFEVLSPDPNDAFLAAGLTEDLIVDFARVEALHVAARSEVASFRERPVPPRTLGRELNVDYVLLGSVRRAGPRARISAQLVRASDGHVVWAERFDRTLEDLFDVQAEVSKHIVEALQVRLAPAEQEMLKRAPTKSAEAYAKYLEARPLVDVRKYDSNLKAELLLKEAIALDPRFALAHAALGEAYARRALWWWEGLGSVEQAEPAVQRALAIEPDLVEAHLVMAMIYRLRGQPEKLLKALERLLVLDPDNTQAMFYAGWSYMAIGHYDQARPIIQRLVDRHPDYYLAPGWLADIDELEGKETEASGRLHRLAVERALEVVRRDPQNWHAQSILAVQLLRVGERDAALVQLERVVAGAPSYEGQVRYNVACTFARLGLVDRAIKELREATSRMPSYLSDWPRRDPDLASLREHPEFIKMFGKA